MKRSTALLAAISLAALTSPAMVMAHEGHTAEAQATKTYTAEQFFESTAFSVGSPSGYNFSPDGKHVLVNSDESGVFNAYLMPLEGGDPVPLTTSTGNATFGSSFFPNDGRLLFTADNGGDELNHVFLRAEDGTVIDLTPGEKVKASFAGWNAAGDTFYILSNERDPAAFDLYGYAADGFERARLFTNEGGFSVDAISDDGRWVALSKAISSADSDLYLVDLAADEPQPVLISEHDGNVSHGVYTFTRDNSALIYATDEHGEFNQAWRYELASGAKSPVLEADWDVAFLQYSPSGRYRVSAINEDALTALTILDTRSGETVTLDGVPEGSLGSIRFDPQETRIAFTVTSDTSPTDIYVANLAGGSAKRLTTALNPAIDETDLVTATVARFPSYDGVEIPGILYKPNGASAAKPAPMVVLVHGGPGGQSTRGYNPMVQHLVNNGYAVYAINNRGSSGYGKTFFHMDDKKHGDVDLRDVVAAKGFLQGLDWVADDRIAVMGGSYGGYMTAAALALHPEVFDAGINIFGVTNWVRTLKSIPPWWGSFRDSLYDEMGDPAVDEERHRAISPLFHAANIIKPMLVVQGANDPRVLQVESDELVAAVKANGVPVEYVLFPDEGHGFRRKENRITASEAYLQFLDEHIGR
ncbi:S9 family peptidase [Qipengyuania sp. 6B39]|uniref:S9 family peptidase n=1 Tax=Qipengyuania proteolytica TaxID=2867239 RepID=UPI001C8AAFA1|nr:S9 family peptidase [Qipengyuania proteolytica]MBX7495084.1 S9 family peptidase [Qipengyuania proteolytica]